MTFNFQDIFKSGFLENVSVFSVTDMVLALLLSFAAGVFIFFIYKKTYAGIMYSASFGITLIALTMITAVLILGVTSNIVLSLGMVGALSIVRFRTAIKEPVDIAFLFWSIAEGIVIAAGFIPLAVFGGLLIGAMIWIFSGYKSFDRPYILVLHCADEKSEEGAEAFLKEQVGRLCLKSKSIAPDCVELNYELRLKDGNSRFLHGLAELPGVSHTVLVSYNGDYMS